MDMNYLPNGYKRSLEFDARMCAEYSNDVPTNTFKSEYPHV